MRERPAVPIGRYLAFSVAGLILVIVLTMGGCGAVKSFNRYQRVQDAKTRTRVVHQEIKTAQQRAAVVHALNAAVRAKAEQRVIEAEGIRKAQDLIARTLTPLYVQHEAIQAQKVQGAGDKIYVPVGAQGIPLVNNIGAEPVVGK
jgi:hypothetical protein